jgi:hypothetical protein
MQQGTLEERERHRSQSEHRDASSLQNVIEQGLLTAMDDDGHSKESQRTSDYMQFEDIVAEHRETTVDSSRVQTLVGRSPSIEPPMRRSTRIRRARSQGTTTDSIRDEASGHRSPSREPPIRRSNRRRGDEDQDSEAEDERASISEDISTSTETPIRRSTRLHDTRRVSLNGTPTWLSNAATNAQYPSS